MYMAKKTYILQVHINKAHLRINKKLIRHCVSAEPLQQTSLKHLYTKNKFINNSYTTT